ncbi:hypothetical protein EYC80_001043 [Monilinia laxa]|uniref:Sema domain-containing protein n=1 Tax=Monilinia laxa TaxID=61186 RepID=A0A5N6K7Y4_MONLA|nr:hypothetical protein EYC80_001043 [Monilinia laxa]
MICRQKFGIIHLIAKKLQNFAEARVRVFISYSFVPLSLLSFFPFSSSRPSYQSQIHFSYFSSLHSQPDSSQTC